MAKLPTTTTPKPYAQLSDAELLAIPRVRELVESFAAKAAAEQAIRIQTIMASQEAKGRERQALRFAIVTNLSAAAVTTLLADAPYENLGAAYLQDALASDIRIGSLDSNHAGGSLDPKEARILEIKEGAIRTNVAHGRISREKATAQLAANGKKL